MNRKDLASVLGRLDAIGVSLDGGYRKRADEWMKYWDKVLPRGKKKLRRRSK